MDAELIDFEEIVDSLNEIPLHQRNYSWKRKHWVRLWATLIQAYMDEETASQESATSNVFMGAMVRLKLDGRSAESQRVNAGRSWNNVRHAIVDGQQRVVSLSVLLCAIRDFYYAPRSQGWNSLTADFLRYRLGRTTDEYGDLKLRVQAEDKVAFDHISAPKTSDGALDELKRLNSSVADAYLFFMEALGTPESDQLQYLSDDLDPDGDGHVPTDNAVGAQSIDDDQQDDDRLEEIDEQVSTAREDSPSQTSLIATVPEIDWEQRGLIDPEVLVGIIANKLKFAVVELDTADEALAFEIFETLNDANEPLANVDKFRNGYFMLAPDDAESVYQNYWLPLEDAHRSGHGRSADLKTLEDFFFNETIRRFGWTPSGKTYGRLMGYIKAKAQVNSSSDRHRQRNRLRILQEEFAGVLNADLAYRRLQGWTLQNEPSNPRVLEDHLSFIRDYSAGPVVPLVMEILIWGQSGSSLETTANNVAAGLDAVEGLLARRALAGIPAQQLRSQLAQLGPSLKRRLQDMDPEESGSTVGDVVRNLFRELGVDRYPDDASLRISVEAPVYERVGKGIQLFRVLWALEQELSNDHASMPVPAYGTGATRWSIEHVMPQGVPVERESTRGRNPVKVELAENWAQDWRDSGVEEIDREFRALRHSIGNLTLLRGRDNSYLGTMSFSEKKDFYRENSDLKLTKSIANCEHWLPANIRERGRMLIEKGILRWRY